MNAPELRELLTPAGLALLDSLPQWTPTTDALASVSALRRAGHSPELAAAVLTQSRLRARARAKFGEFAERMLFTEAGLEQATRLAAAAVHAARFRERVTEVVDLGCGIGGDSLAFAAAGLGVLAIEADEATAALATHNLEPFPEARVEHARAEALPLPPGSGVWADPARRTVDQFGASRRIARLSDYAPAVEWLLGLAATHPLGIKLGPGLDRNEIPTETSRWPVEAQWVDAHGDVVEMCLWTGGLARERVGRSALVIGTHGAAELAAPDDLPDVEPGPLGRYLYEPSGAVIRARLLPLVAEPLRAHTISSGIAYLSSDSLSSSPFASAFEVSAELPADVRSLKRELAARNIGRLEIKKRGWDGDPALMRKRLELRGDQSATLFLTRVAGRHRALLAQRVSGAEEMDTLAE